MYTLFDKEIVQRMIENTRKEADSDRLSKGEIRTCINLIEGFKDFVVKSNKDLARLEKELEDVPYSENSHVERAYFISEIFGDKVSDYSFSTELPLVKTMTRDQFIDSYYSDSGDLFHHLFGIYSGEIQESIDRFQSNRIIGENNLKTSFIITPKVVTSSGLVNYAEYEGKFDRVIIEISFKIVMMKSTCHRFAIVCDSPIREIIKNVSNVNNFLINRNYPETTGIVNLVQIGEELYLEVLFFYVDSPHSFIDLTPPITEFIAEIFTGDGIFLRDEGLEKYDEVETAVIMQELEDSL